MEGRMREQSGPLGADVAVTHILVVGDPARSRDFWVDALGAELYREYGGTSVVLRFAATWRNHFGHRDGNGEGFGVAATRPDALTGFPVSCYRRLRGARSPLLALRR
jgi:catechol 2,3-dioxygenase-like lactoylglutathione lyase family enzyme